MGTFESGLGTSPPTFAVGSSASTICWSASAFRFLRSHTRGGSPVDRGDHDPEHFRPASGVTFELILIGYGRVAQRFVRLLDEQRAHLSRNHGLAVRIVGI